MHAREHPNHGRANESTWSTAGRCNPEFLNDQQTHECWSLNVTDLALPTFARHLKLWLITAGIVTPTAKGAGTNEDIVLVLRASDVILYEGTPRSETFRETRAEGLPVLIRFFNYAALHSERFPQSISVVSGTGLITPAF